ncbi:ribosome maturation factor RimM [Vacuolonema iberomarrocanum]|uniref:ribosome maturation factor RimM n=1 Tax=Vacuolonema iberomarrocanum TaxID=3454632 RepID=UPI0019DBDE38|nr:ribosome maturation factor RimM [filamentous cyanobacterium LEGE 07170]
MTTSTKKSPQSDKPTPIPDGWLEIGTIVGAHGLQGELRVYPASDFPERFEQPGERWLLAPDGDTPQSTQLVRGRFQHGKGLFIIKLGKVDYRDQAEALRRWRLIVPESDRPPLEENEYHVADLIGLQVVDQETGEAIGVVSDVLPAGNDLLQVTLDAPQNPKNPNVLIPFVPEIVPVVDLENGFVAITPPPGLIEG